MFGGEFGAFRTRGRHFFNEDGSVYKELNKILVLRKQKIALRRGRQYLREISGDGQSFGLPHLLGGRMLSVVPWTRSFDDQHLLLAINTDPDRPQTAWVNLNPFENPAGARLTCLYSSAPGQVGQGLAVQAVGDRALVSLNVPAAGFVIYE
jgi:hypothetical protein